MCKILGVSSLATGSWPEARSEKPAANLPASLQPYLMGNQSKYGQKFHSLDPNRIIRNTKFKR
jgi:hypothetical protein